MSKSIERFLQGIRKKSTLRRYKRCIEDFFKFLDADADKYVEKISQNKFKFEIDIWKFITYLIEDKKISPKSIALHISAIKNFCIMNEMNIQQRVFVSLKRRTPKAIPIMQDAIPTKKILREIFQHCDFKTKTIAMFMLSSGMRIGETVNLKISDIEMDYNGFVKVNIPRHIAKGGYARVTFISSEAKELLEKWISKERKVYIKQARIKTNFKGKRKVSLRDTHLFPMGDSNVRVSWNGALNRSGYNDKCQNTGFYKYHLHTLRKWFKTNLSGNINQNALNIMIGNISELDRIYTDLTYEDKIKDLYNEYKKGESNISIYTTGISEGEVASLEIQLKEKGKRLDDVTTRLDRFVNLRKRRSFLMDKREKDEYLVNGKIKYKTLTEEEMDEIKEEIADIDIELLDL